MKKGVLYIFLLIGGCFMAKVSFATNPDSLKNPAYLNGLIKYNYYYDFLRYDQNIIEWADYSAVDDFFYKLRTTHKRKLSVLHIGDSHIQADIFTGFLRDQLQETFGYGGRGFIFPYKAAGTHSAYDYRTYAKGEWEKSRNVEREILFDIGITGATIHTTDSSASFKFVFSKRYNSIHESFTVLKLFVKKSENSFDLIVRNSSDKQSYEVDVYNETSDSPYFRIDLQNAPDTLEFIIHKTDSLQDFLECYGLILESPDDKGVLYNSVGINGAGYTSILKQTLFGPHLEVLNPDLIILDLGANDFFLGAYNYAVMSNNLNRIIDIIKTASPSSEILITNSQDIYSRRRNIASCQDFSTMTKEIAFERGCAFYDYYNVSGGQYAMLKWRSYNLAQYDRIHLTTPGYTTKTQLFYNAILNSMIATLNNPQIDSFIADTNCVDTSNFVAMLVDKESINRDSKAPTYTAQNNNNNHYDQYYSSGDKTYYTIQSGDNLGYIAEKFHVNVSDLKRWNGIIGSRIIAGEKLIVYSKTPVTNSSSNNSNKTVNANTNVSVSNGTKTYYTIQPGDVLGSIAAKFSVSVSDLKSWNRISGSNIRAGDKLVIYKGGVTKNTSTNNSSSNQTNQSNSNNNSKFKNLKNIVHIVKSGDTLWGIAQKYGVSVNHIKTKNKLSSERLDVGQRLIIK
jgi:LysM repeat protein/lysophospholipase L1-like esterase